ncbi:hypothetical protein [Microbacterium marinilacus]|uniref:PknH-like extracellular domain-containing protein n=1 Tax=Microbacterium marinilacus TaxID=415209 RepID=A0ABP7B1E6_9MICO|nr:hypothetical protein [Microbacterium marinilacus]MBY0688641.1 hypothetical protein [Microbacterium marinilacus]
MKRTLTTMAVAASAALLLAGCSAADEPDGAAETTSPAASASAPAPSSSSTPSEPVSEPLTDAQLATVFETIMFGPDEYDTTAELLDSIYPGLAVSDRSCLAPFGAEWESAAGDGGTAEFGTSTDRSMTAVVVSAAGAAAADELLAQSEDALTRCADGEELFTMQGEPVTTTVEPYDLALTGADDSLGWKVSGDVAGSSFTLIGSTVRVGDEVLALVGWDPSTNTDYVPRATQMFVDELAGARG